MQNRYLDFLIDPSFQGVNRLFVLSFKDADGQKGHKQYYLPTVEIKDYNVMIDGRNFFVQPIRNDLKHMAIFEKFLQVKEMTTQLIV